MSLTMPATRQELIDYCLRALGEDVINIEISDQQAEDRLDAALQFMQEYHFDFTSDVYLKHRVTASTVRLTTPTAADFNKGEVVTGSVSGVSFTLYTTATLQDADDLLITTVIGGTLSPGETLTGATSGTTAIVNTITVNSVDVADVTIGDTENRWVPISDAVTGVKQILPVNSSFTGSDFNMFDIRYQLMLNDMFSLTSISMLYYTQVQSHLDMIQFILMPNISYQFNRVDEKLYINADWEVVIAPGDWLIFECTAIMDPDNFPKVYNDMMLKKYLIAAFKWQWGNNLRKYKGLQLPGGVLFDAADLMAEGTAEMTALEDKIMRDFQLPVGFLVG